MEHFTRNRTRHPNNGTFVLRAGPPSTELFGWDLTRWRMCFRELSPHSPIFCHCLSVGGAVAASPRSSRSGKVGKQTHTEEDYIRQYSVFVMWMRRLRRPPHSAEEFVNEHLASRAFEILCTDDYLRISRGWSGESKRSRIKQQVDA